MGENNNVNKSAQPPREALSIIIPVRNRVDLVGRTLKSVASQTYRPINLIVVDNGSDDETMHVLRAFKQKYDNGKDFNISILTESTPGACAARNRGLAEVTTPFTMFFDSDDVMMPEHVERAMEKRRLCPDADIIGWDVKIIGDDDFSTVKPFEINDMQFHNLFHGTMATQRYMARTQLFRDAGAWKEDVPVWNDIELGARLLSLTDKVEKITGGTSVLVFAHDNSITGAGFHVNPKRFKRSLTSISDTFPSEKRHWIALKAIILAANVTRGNSEEGRAIFTEAMEKVSGAKLRSLYRIAYHYTRLGGRGAARLLKPLIG